MLILGLVIAVIITIIVGTSLSPMRSGPVRGLLRLTPTPAAAPPSAAVVAVEKNKKKN